MEIKIVFDSNSIPEDSQKMAKVLIETLCRVVKVDGVTFMNLDKEKNELAITISCDKDLETAQKKLGISVKVGERVCGKAAEKKEAILVVGDIAKDSRFARLKKYEEIYSGMSVPAIKKNEVIGVLNVKRTKSNTVLTTDDLSTACIFANKLAENL
jgi:GAF domain-containing protein